MDEFKEFNDVNISYEEAEKTVSSLYVQLKSLYTVLACDYEELNRALNELMTSRETDVDMYVHALHKVSFLSFEIEKKTTEELDILEDNVSLFNHLVTYIKKRKGIRYDADYEDFTIMDTYIKKEYIPLKEDYITMRMLRAISYYRKYDAVKKGMMIGLNSTFDEEDIRAMLCYDKPDIDSVDTLGFIFTNYETADTVYLYNKYKTLFSFVNPTIERYFLNRDFSEDHEYLFCEYGTEITKDIKNDIIKSIATIQRNKVINKDDKKINVVFNRDLTLKQKTDILFNFSHLNSRYHNRFEMLKKDYLYNMEIIALLNSYIQQSYENLDEQSIKDLDHLLDYMTKENTVTLGNTKLKKKVVKHFFDKDHIIKEKQRSRINTLKEDE